MIEILALLDQKTRGNLTAEERQCSNRCSTSCACGSSTRPARQTHHRTVTSLCHQPFALSLVTPQPSLRVTVLGSGTSLGVPAIGCDCAVCHSSDPRDRRTRPSILIEVNGTSILVDTSTDLRMQALANDVRRVDAILFTHSHADHVFGLDDVRATTTCSGRRSVVMPTLRPWQPAPRVFVRLRSHRPEGRRAPAADAVQHCRTVLPRRRGDRAGTVMHGRLPILGFRIGSFAYLTDCNHIPDASWPLLTEDGGVRTVIIDALRHRSHPTHFSVAEAVDAIARLGADRVPHAHLPRSRARGNLRATARGVELAYDGLVLEVA